MPCWLYNYLYTATNYGGTVDGNEETSTNGYQFWRYYTKTDAYWSLTINTKNSSYTSNCGYFGYCYTTKFYVIKSNGSIGNMSIEESNNCNVYCGGGYSYPARAVVEINK